MFRNPEIFSALVPQLMGFEREEREQRERLRELKREEEFLRRRGVERYGSSSLYHCLQCGAEWNSKDPNYKDPAPYRCPKGCNAKWFGYPDPSLNRD